MQASSVRLVLLLLGCGLAQGCRPASLRPMARLLSGSSGQSGWFSIEPAVAQEGEGGADDPLWEQERYERRFYPQWLDRSTACDSVASLRPAPPAPVFILVHGIYGDGPEWWPVIPVLDEAKPGAVFMFRWSLVGRHGELLEALTAGVDRLAECFPDAQLVLLAHSAGGVISSAAAHGFAVTSRTSQPRLWVMTVASPLAGTGYRGQAEPTADDSESRLLFELGGSPKGYPAAPPGVAVIHFRTQYPADKVMRPNVLGHAPNQKGVGVAGAKEVDLPAEIGHEPALLYLAQEIVAGRIPSPEGK